MNNAYKKWLLVVLSSIFLSGCGWDPQMVKGQDGSEKYILKCGLAHPENCYEQAASSCSKGYKEENFNTGTLQPPMPHLLVVTCNK